MGRCNCGIQYFGDACQFLACPNSVCIYDNDTIEPACCIHCSNNGICNNGVCVCNKGYVGSDCSMEDCINGCSSTASAVVGVCIHNFPVSQCDCLDTAKRGGDYCEIVICLNGCSANGVCNSNGECVCNTDFYGEDCSVKIYQISIS